MTMRYLAVEYSRKVAQYPRDGQWYLAIVADAQAVPAGMPDEACLDLFFGPLRDRVAHAEIERDRAGETALAGVILAEGYRDKDAARNAYDRIMVELSGRSEVVAQV